MKCLSVALALALITPISMLASDHPVREVSVPSPGLRLVAFLDHSRLQPGRSVQLKVELRNEGTGQVLIPGAGRCNPALQLTIWGRGDAVVWAQGLPLCLEPYGTPSMRLAPGSSVSAEHCFELAGGTGATAHCARLELPSASYQVGGTFYGMTLPRLNLTLEP